MKYHKNKFYLKKKNCLFVLLLMFILLSGISLVNLEDYYPSDNVEYSYYRVANNDTLWTIADNYKYNDDKRDFIIQIKEINNIDDNLQVGNIIAIPINK